MRLRDETGQFVPKHCPNLFCDGELVCEDGEEIFCNGLVDPNDDSKELEACTYKHPEYALAARRESR